MTGTANKITAGEVQRGDAIAQAKRGPFRRVLAISEGPSSRWLTFEGGARIRPGRERQLWRLEPEQVTFAGDEHEPAQLSSSLPDEIEQRHRVVRRAVELGQRRAALLNELAEAQEGIVTLVRETPPSTVTLAELARLTGVSRQTLHAWRSSSAQPSPAA